MSYPISFTSQLTWPTTVFASTGIYLLYQSLITNRYGGIKNPVLTFTPALLGALVSGGLLASQKVEGIGIWTSSTVASILVPAVLSVVFAPSLLLNIPGGNSLAEILGGNPSSASAFVHAVVVWLVFSLLRSRFHNFYH